MHASIGEDGTVETVRFPSSTDSVSISYQVMDVLGAVRAEGEVDGDVFTLDVHSLANGIYYLRSQDGTSAAVVSGKFVVEK